MDSKFMNNAYVLGEVRDKELNDVGSGESLRENNKVRLNVASENGFVNIQMRTPKKANTNFAEQLYDEVEEGEILEVSGSLEEFLYNDTYRRNVSPYVSTKNGYGNSVSVYPSDSEKEFKANARLAGDIIEKEEFVTEDNETGHKFTLLHFNMYRADTRKEVILNAINNFGDYAKDTGKDIDFNKLSDLRDSIELLDDEDLSEVVNIYKEFKEVFNPLMFNIDEYHITATGEIAEEMETVEIFDNITVGVYLINDVVIDEFGFANGSENKLEVGVFKGINESLGDGLEELGTKDW